MSQLVGALGFEPRIARTRIVHVSRYTMPRNKNVKIKHQNAK